MKSYPEELKERARELHKSRWLTARDIAQLLGVSATTVARWVNPEYAERARKLAREHKRKNYAGVCVDCGAKTSYSGVGTKGCERCVPCFRKHQLANRYWTRERILEAIHAWAAAHGRRPASTDWIRKGPNHPSFSAVYGTPSSPFKSWADALRAAGYEVYSPPGPGKRLFDRREARQLRVQGLSNAQIAEQLGVTPSAIHHALGRGTPKPIGRRSVPRNREQRIAALQRALVQQGEG